MKFRTLIAALCISSMASTTMAQDYEQYVERQRDLTVLAAVFGEMHHIRRICEPRYEADVWRERMKQLISLEEPEEQVRNQLVAQFNDGYRQAQRRFSGCDRRARDYAAARAAQGEGIVRRLTTSLEQEQSFDQGPLFIQPQTESLTVNE
ncbi:TIGR02301 family protein [Hyphococcus flavus]|uniref:TIGR02301 family protein n=1 Tax=Hyphococcus flavus TaxID=1866326 RepID=A0AAF0CFV1_9PROT|nr:TIGR02301 family protein [Hyphococcus flavus]WDI31754.1 TIGR02301 family protein [Hyphococcus flavus]